MFYLQVNGVPLTGLTHTEAIEFLRQTPDTVTLRMYRPPEDELSFDTQSQTTKYVSLFSHFNFRQNKQEEGHFLSRPYSL